MSTNSFFGEVEGGGGAGLRDNGGGEEVKMAVGVGVVEAFHEAVDENAGIRFFEFNFRI